MVFRSGRKINIASGMYCILYTHTQTGWSNIMRKKIRAVVKLYLVVFGRVWAPSAWTSQLGVWVRVRFWAGVAFNGFGRYFLISRSFDLSLFRTDV
jgi:hypothetical protein